MLVLSRKQDQKIVFPNLGITVEVVNLKGSTVRLGIDAPRSIEVLRGELEGAESGNSISKQADEKTEERDSHFDNRNRNEMQNYLKVASRSISNARTRSRRDGPESAESHFARAMEALNVMSRLMEGDQSESVDTVSKIPLQVYAKQFAGSNLNGDVS